MVLDLGAKYDVLTKTVAEKQSGNEPLANLFQNTESIFTDEVANTALPEKFKVLDIPIFTGNEDPMEHLMTFQSIRLYTRPLTQWHAEPFHSPCHERLETGSGIFYRGLLIILIPLDKIS